MGPGTRRKILPFLDKALTVADLSTAIVTRDWGKVSGVVIGYLVGEAVASIAAIVLAGAALPATATVLLVATIGGLAGVAAGEASESIFDGAFGTPQDELLSERISRLLSDGISLRLPNLGYVVEYGADADDVLVGIGSESNSIIAFGGDDYVNAGGGSDYVSGGSGSDVLNGEDGDDTILGGLDSDILSGGSGNDALDGGGGFDTYRFNSSDFESGAFKDTIVDSDGLGKILFNGLDIAGTGIGFDHIQHASLGAWETSGGEFRLAVIGSGGAQSLLIMHNDSDSYIVVQNWNNGDLGISLPGLAEQVAETAGMLTGAADLFGQTGTNIGNDIINGLAGNDGIDGGAGEDYLDGGANDDLILGGSGNDRIFGGDGNDHIVDGSELANLRQWTAEESQTEEANIAALGAAVVARGQDWYIQRTAEGVYVTTAPEWTFLDPDTNKSGDDIIDAGAGDDHVWAGEGNDTIIGGSGADFLVGGHDNDIINGGDDDDTIDGDLPISAIAGDSLTAAVSVHAERNGNDIIDGGGGNDVINGMGGNDAIYGGDGDDTLRGFGRGDAEDAEDADSDYIDGGIGNDVIDGGGGEDTLLGGEGDDTLLGDNITVPLDLQLDDVLDGGAGNDTIQGFGGNDTLVGGAGADTLLGDSEALSGDAHGNDVIRAGSENDIAAGMGGNDVIYGDEGDDQLLGDANEAELALQYHGNDLVYGGAGNDQIWGGGGNDTLDGGIGTDALSGESGTDRLSGGAGDDQLWGGDGDDQLDGGEGSDQLAGGEGNDFQMGGGGNDSIYGEGGNDLLDGGSGNDSIGGGDGADRLVGGEGTDTLDGGAGADHLEGGSYADNLYGGDGNDILDGGEGSDYLYGGSGVNQYLVGPTSGTDYIFNESPGTATGSFVEFSSGITPEDVTYSLSGSTLIVRYSSTLSGELRISGFASNASQSPVSSFHFSNGIILSYEDIRSLLLTSTGGNDSITGFGSDDTIVAGLGNDAVYAAGGNDSVYGEAGNDTLDGGNGSDLIDGGSGNDLIYGDSGIEIGNDVLRGGAGNDRLYGGEGNDLFLYSRNDGLDDITESEDTDNSDIDVVRLGAGILPEHVTLYRARRDALGYDELVIVVDGSNQQIWVSSYFSPQGNSIERIEFDNGNGPFWTETDVQNLLQPMGLQNSMAGTSGNDVFVVDHESDVITEQSNGGIDLIESSRSFTTSANVENITLTGVLSINATGNTLNNIIRGNSGDNVIDGGNGNDTAYGGAGDDVYRNVEQVNEIANEGFDTVYSSNQTVILPVNVESLVVSGLAMLGSGGYYFKGNSDSNVILVDSRYSYSCLIDGSFGADVMSYKGSGNITFKVDDVGDQILFLGTQDSTAPASGQVISVESSLGGEQNLASFVNNYSTTSNLSLSIVGNDRNNRLSATQAAAGSSLAGGKGDDVYILSTGLQVQSSQGVQFIEQANDGFDTIYISSGESAPTPENGFVLPGDSFVIPDNFEAVDLGYYQGNANLGGNATDNLIVGNAWDNIIDGGAGADTMRGRQGSDTYYVDSISDLVVEEYYGDRDKVFSSVNYALTSNVEDLVLTGLAISGVGNELDNHLVGNSLGNSLVGGGGNDNLEGMDGNDEIDGGTFNDTLSGGNGSDTYVFGRGYGSDSISNYDEGIGRYDVIRMQQGISLTDISLARIANDLVVKIVGTWDEVTIKDYYLDDAYKIDAIHLFDGTVITAQDMDIPANNPPSVGFVLPFQEMVEGIPFALLLPENLFVDEPNEALELSFDLIPSWLSYDPVTRLFSGTPPNGAASGAFSIICTDSVGQSVTTTLSYAVLNAVLGTANVDSLVGTSGRDALFGYAGNDSLNGGIGADQMSGGLGDDTYSVDDVGDIVVEALGEGSDLVHSAVSYSLSQEVERLTLTGTSANSATGNAGSNILTGNSASNTLTGLDGNDTLDGKAGTDTLLGGVGDDLYIVDVVGDIVQEALSAGIDAVQSSVTYTLSANVENLTMTGSSAINGTGNAESNTLIGNSGVNTLTGLGGNDSLDGKGGADILKGGAGDDTYIVDNTGDVVTEIASEGTDTVNASVTYTLSANVERLTLTGSGAINGTGNGDANILIGNTGNNNLFGLVGNDILDGLAGNDTLDGGTGNDTLRGGQGDDTYVLDSATDIVVELSGEGNDLVNASATYTLSSEVERLTLTGTTAINGTGNAVANTLTGNSGVNTLTGLGGNDVLNGGAGADILKGGTGDDSYVVDNTGDVVTELAGEGNDLVSSSVTYTLASEVEALTLTGSSAINATGNAAANTLTGNSGNNVLTGLAGADVLEGKVGTDTLTGGTGNDTYVMARTFGADTVIENDATAANLDIARFVTGVAYDQLWFKRPASSNNLEISIIGTTDKLVIKDWYLGGQYRVEEIRTVDGNKVLYAADVQALVTAMATLTQPAAGQTTLTASQRTALSSVLASAWKDSPAGMQMMSGSLPAMILAEGDSSDNPIGTSARVMAGGSRANESQSMDSSDPSLMTISGQSLYDMVIGSGFGGVDISCELPDTYSARTMADCRRLIDVMALSDRSGRESFNTHLNFRLDELLP